MVPAYKNAAPKSPKVLCSLSEIFAGPRISRLANQNPGVTVVVAVQMSQAAGSTHRTHRYTDHSEFIGAFAWHI